MPSDLIAFWQRCNLDRAPFAHPDDWLILRRDKGRYIDEVPQDFAAFVSGRRFGNAKDTRFHLSLLPIPYGGNLRTAEIVVLLLNPGFSPTDSYAESCVPAFRDRLKRTLAQDFAGVEFPFVWLDPEYCWHSGFVWWESKLRGIVRQIAKEKFGCQYRDALRDLSRRLALVQLVPYHSPSFSAHALIKDLPSVKAAKRFAQGALATAAGQGKLCIIVTRQIRSWALPEPTDNLIVYEGALARGASLGSRSKGGQAILARYGIKPRRLVPQYLNDFDLLIWGSLSRLRLMQVDCSP